MMQLIEGHDVIRGDGSVAKRVLLLSDETPSSLELTGADVPGLNEEDVLAAGRQGPGSRRRDAQVRPPAGELQPEIMGQQEHGDGEEPEQFGILEEHYSAAASLSASASSCV